MSNVIKIKTDLDFTGSNGGKDIPCFVFDGEPTAEQQAECHANGISMEWTNGKTYAPSNQNYEHMNEISLTAEKIFWMFAYLIIFAVVIAVVWAVVGMFL